MIGDNTKITVSKLDSAIRQLDCAIDLWFNDKDEVSVHTLAAAAYQIVDDINKHRGIGADLMYNSALIKPEYHSTVNKLLRMAMTFFKHAKTDPDPDGTIELDPFLSLGFMLFCAMGLNNLEKQPTDKVQALVIWTIMHEPDLMLPGYKEALLKSVDIQSFQQISTLNKADFFQRHMQALVRLRSKGLIG